MVSENLYTTSPTNTKNITYNKIVLHDIYLCRKEPHFPACPSPVTQGQVVAAAVLDEHELGAEEQLLHDVRQQAGVHLRVVQLPGQGAAVANQLLAALGLVAVQGEDGHAEVGAGGLGEGGAGDVETLAAPQKAPQRSVLPAS